MTATEIRQRVAQIAKIAKLDYEVAHSMEDELHRDVLQWFADQGYSVAIAALETTKIQFPRHCA